MARTEDLAIKSMSFYWATSQRSQRIADSTHQIGEIRFLVCRIETQKGIRGESHLLAFDYSEGALTGSLKDLANLVPGYSIADTGIFARDWRNKSEYFGIEGVQTWTLGLVDIAMWDAWARSLEIPVWRLFGTHAHRVPVYGSGGWLSYGIEELTREAQSYVGRGFAAVKVKVGSGSLETDVERIAKVRETVGRSVRIMMDANQGLSYVDALRLAQAVIRYDIEWFEEPLPHFDFEGYAKLRRSVSCALAMGEREYNTVALRELATRRAIDLWQPDILRLGGVEAWRASAAVAAAHGIPVLPHYYKEYDVPLLCTIPNGQGAEWFDWVDGLVDKPVRFDGGYAYPSEQPGWGFSFLDKHLREIAL